METIQAGLHLRPVRFKQLLYGRPLLEALVENMKVYNFKSIKCIEKEGMLFSDGFKIIFQDCINDFERHYNLHDKNSRMN